MQNQTQKFRVQIWFDDITDKMLLGTVSVYASSEFEALELAQSHLDYQVNGVDNVSWQIREPRAAYAY